MSIYDRWHKSRPDLGEEKCRQHRMVPSSAHGQGERWQVRWRDENGKQCKRNFAKKEGKDPELHADAFDAKVNSSLDAGTYVDPATGNITFQEYAEGWRTARTGRRQASTWSTSFVSTSTLIRRIRGAAGAADRR